MKAKLHTTQTSFVSGQLDAAAQARTETALYRTGAAELLNCIPVVTGGVAARWGTLDCGLLYGDAVLAEFRFSLDQSYVAVFTQSRCDFFFHDTAIPAGAVGDCPWTVANLRNLRFAQLGDTMWVVHPSFWPIEIVRVGLTSWTQRPMVFDSVKAMPTFRYGATAVHGQASGAAASELVIAALPIFAATALPLVVGQEGRAKGSDGIWHPFTIASFVGLTITPIWTGVPLPSQDPITVQMDSYESFRAMDGGEPIAQTSGGGGDGGGGGGAGGE